MNITVTVDVTETQSLSALRLSDGLPLSVLYFTCRMKVPIKHRHVARSTIACYKKKKKGQYMHTSRENKQENSFEKNISLWEGVLVLKGQYTQAERTSYKKRKYFTLGGCSGGERPIHKQREHRPIYRTRYSNSFSENI